MSVAQGGDPPSPSRVFLLCIIRVESLTEQTKRFESRFQQKRVHNRRCCWKKGGQGIRLSSLGSSDLSCPVNINHSQASLQTLALTSSPTGSWGTSLEKSIVYRTLLLPGASVTLPGPFEQVRDYFLTSLGICHTQIPTELGVLSSSGSSVCCQAAYTLHSVAKWWVGGVSALIPSLALLIITQL